MTKAIATSPRGLLEGRSPTGHDWRFLLTPEETWRAVYDDCAAAARSIEFEQYIFSNDDVGKRFLSLFARKVQKNVRVRMIFDPFGSLGHYYSPMLIRRLRRAGVKVCFFHPPRFFHLLAPWAILPRTHAKTMLIDSRIAYIGGVCFNGHMQDWRDTQIRITGPVVKEVRASFDSLWERQVQKKQRHVGEPFRMDPEFRLAVAFPRMRSNPIYEELRKRIRQSERIVLITSPFFIPSRSFIRLLGGATKRGVNVRVMVSEASDVRLADYATLSYFPALLARGVRIFLYRNNVLHAKTMVVDEGWATIGSMNIDYLSVFRNREANLIITERAAVEELAQHFMNDTKLCREFTYADWLALPRWCKVLAATARVFRPVL